MRGASGGGTLCSGELQLLQNSPPDAPARSQWPRAAHSGLMHCTVQPGKYCTFFPPLFRRAPSRARTRMNNAQSSSDPAPPVFCEPENHREKLPGFCASALVASRAKIQFLVVRLQTGPSDTPKFALPALRPAGIFVLPPYLGRCTFALYNFSSLAHNLCFRWGMPRKLLKRFMKKIQSGRVRQQWRTNFR